MMNCLPKVYKPGNGMMEIIAAIKSGKPEPGELVVCIIKLSALGLDEVKQ